MYLLQHHKTMTLEKWSAYAVDRQIFMIANEINRLMNGIKVGLTLKDLRETLERAFELIDLTVACQIGSLQWELLRFRELISEFYLLSEAELKENSLQIEKLCRILLFMNSKTSVLN